MLHCKPTNQLAPLSLDQVLVVNTNFKSLSRGTEEDIYDLLKLKSAPGEASNTQRWAEGQTRNEFPKSFHSLAMLRPDTGV